MTGAPPSTVVVPRLKTLIEINGGAPSADSTPRAASAIVAGVKLQGFTLTHSLTTYLDEYEVPSGGDWSMHRGGAVFATGVSGLTVERVHFTQLGGNAVMLSEYARETTFHSCEFSWIGDSGISQLGSVKFDRTHDKSPESTDLLDGTDGEHPHGTTVQGCVFREIGVYGKQVSAFASALAYGASINGSIFFNGPRAGINGMMALAVGTASRRTCSSTGYGRHQTMVTSTAGTGCRSSPPALALPAQMCS